MNLVEIAVGRTVLLHKYIKLEVEEETYLGEIIRRDGKNTSNVRSRVAKGIGITSQIVNILNIVIFGRFRMETGHLMRQSVFLSAILSSSEAWYNVNNDDVKELEKVDRRKDLGNTNYKSDNIPIPGNGENYGTKHYDDEEKEFLLLLVNKRPMDNYISVPESINESSVPGRLYRPSEERLGTVGNSQRRELVEKDDKNCVQKYDKDESEGLYFQSADEEERDEQKA